MRQDSNGVILCANIAILANVLSVISSTFFAIVIKAIEINRGIAEWIANLSDTLETITGGLTLVVGIVFFIIFIIWLRTYYGNLSQKVDKLKFSVGWSVGGWFVPIWNLFRPYQVVKDLFLRTNDYLSSDDNNHLTMSAVNIWWTLNIATLVIGRLSWQAVRMVNPDTGEGFFTSTIIELIAGLLNVAFYIYAKKVVKEYSKAEQSFV